MPSLSASAVPIERMDVSAFEIPTEAPESDGTAEWRKTVLVVVEPRAGGQQGLGYTYANAATARLIHDELVEIIRGQDAFSIGGCWRKMTGALRNVGRPGICAMAVSAVDAALWDLKARLLGIPLAVLFGQAWNAVPVYGSGGFTSYSEEELCRQLAGWRESGLSRVKMKIGREPERDVSRVQAARRAIGPDCQLFVDANGAYTAKQALALAEHFADQGVSWFEEPVSSDDLQGLRLIRDRGPVGMDIAAGEYGYDVRYFRNLLAAGAVDVLQADATRCGGFTGFLQVGALCEAWGIGLSSHCAPALHLSAGCALNRFVHMEWFFDHVRIEQMLFQGAQRPVEGVLRPDLSRPGTGLALKRAEAERFVLQIA